MISIKARWAALVGAFVVACSGGLWGAAPSLYTGDWATFSVLGHWGLPRQAVVGYPFEYRLSVFGTATSYDATGLPAGLSVDHTTGLVSGAPQEAGSFSIVLMASNADGTSTATVSLPVLPAPTAAPVIENMAEIETMQGGNLGRDLDNYLMGFRIPASNLPSSYTVAGLPAAATYDEHYGFVLWGVNEIASGRYTVTMTATNPLGTGTNTVVINAHPRLLRVTADKPMYNVGDTITLQATFDGPVVVAGVPQITIPVGGAGWIAQYSSGSGTPVLSFTYRTQPDDFLPATVILIQRVDLNGGTIAHPSGVPAVLTAPHPFIGYIDPTFAGVQLPACEITSASAATGRVGAPFAFSLTATHSPNTFEIISGTLPPGLSIDPKTGSISGTPQTEGAATITVGARNLSQLYWTHDAIIPASLTITVSATPPPTPTPVTITNAAVNGTVNVPLTYAVQATGAPNQFAAEGLPAGLSIDNSGSISGTPTMDGTFTVAISASNAIGGSATGTLTFTIAAAPPPPPPPATPAPVITSATTASATAGTPFSYRIEATNSATAFAAVGLPPGTALDTAAGLVSGAPTTVGTYVITVSATNSGGTGTATLTVNVAPVPTVPPVVPPPSASPPPTAPALATQSVSIVPVPSIHVGQSVALTATASSGLPVTFSILSGNATLTGSTLTLRDAGPVVVRATQPGNSAFAPAIADVTLVAAKANQQVDFSTPVSAVYVGQPIPLGAVSSSGLPIVYSVVSGPGSINGSTLTITGTEPVVVRASQAGNETFAGASTDLTFNAQLPPLSRLVNLSSRVRVAEGDASRSFIAGFVVSGAAPKRMLLRAVGPGLSGFGIQDALPNPLLRVFDSAGRVIAETDDWTGSEGANTAAQLGAFSLGAGSRDAALLLTLAPGAYSLQVVPNSGAGVALIEAYDASDSTTAPLINVSTRGYVDRGEGVLVAGFVVSGNAPKRVLIRGVGPALAGFSVPGVLADPMVKVYADGEVIAQNDEWSTGQPGGTQAIASAAELASAAQTVGAFALAAGSKDAALIVTLAPGAYTAIVSGANGTTGAGLVEVYELPARVP